MSSDPNNLRHYAEEIPLHNVRENEADGGASSSNGGLRRSTTDAHLSQFKPQIKVRFNSLAARINEQQISGRELLSPRAHQIGLCDGRWSGGWQDTILKRRRSGLSPHSEEEELQEIVLAMIEDERLMANSIDGERLRREALRKLTKPLCVRKELVRRLTVSRTSRDRSQPRLSFFKNIKYNFVIKWYKVKDRIRTTLRDYSLWRRDLKTIEGIFGSSVGSYFRFLRFLFLINLLVALFVMSSLLVPQLLDNGSDSLGLKSRDSSSIVSFNADVNETAFFKPLDWLTGSGWFGTTLIFYGAYSSGFLHFVSSGPSYNMPHAYFFTIYSCIFFYLIVLLYKIVVLYRTNYIDAEEDPTLTFVNKVYLGWDFNITDEKAAKIKQRSIYNELVELVEELNEEKVENIWKFVQRRIVQALSWFVLVSFLLLLCWGLYLLLRYQRLSFHNVVEYWSDSFYLLVYPFIVTLLMVVLPLVFENAGKIEIYHKPRYELYVNVVRVILLGIIVLLPLIIFWYENSPGLRDELGKAKQTLLFPSMDVQWRFSKTSSNFTVVKCWENGLGQEIYRLVVVDFLVILVTSLGIDSLKVILYQRGNIRESSLKFSIPRYTLHTIYNQTLLWAGLFFCPLLPLFIAVKFFIMFQLQKFTLLHNLRPLARPWRASQSETLFQALNLFCLILTIFSNGFIVVRGYSSSSCGPFKKFNHYLDIVWNAFESSEKVILEIVAFLLKPGFVFFFLIFLSICVYCLKSIAEGRQELVSVLRKQLQLEGKDRVYLQNLIEKVNRGERIPLNMSTVSSEISFVAATGTSDETNLTKRSSFVFTRVGASERDESIGQTSSAV